MVSIIVPVYNGRKTINKCLDSILQQTYTDYEVVVIDDGSNDGCVDVIKEYELKDSRIKLYCQKNSGVSKARNYGIDKAKGDFITFVDCDDWISPDMLEEMMIYMNDGDIDIVFVNLFYEYHQKQTIGELSSSPIKKHDFSSYPLAILLPELSSFYDGIKQGHEIIASAWGKMLRKELIFKYNIRFNEGLVLSEDAFFYLNCFIKARDIVICDKPLYHYVISDNSSNFKLRPDIYNQSKEYYQCHIDLACKLDSRFSNLFKQLVIYRCYYDLITRYIGHPDLPHSNSFQYRLLKKYLRYKEYDYQGPIPEGINVFKMAEIFALKHKWSLVLLLLHKIRQIHKNNNLK